MARHLNVVPGFGVVIVAVLVGGMSLGGPTTTSSPPDLKEGHYLLICSAGEGWAMDLPSQHAHDPEGDVRLSKANGSDFQIWHIFPSPNVPGTFKIASVIGDDKYLQPEKGDLDRDGREIHFYPKSDSGYQSWWFEKQPSGRYRIKNVGSGMYLDERAQDMSKVQQHPNPDPSITNELWTLQPAK